LTRQHFDARIRGGPGCPDQCIRDDDGPVAQGHHTIRDRGHFRIRTDVDASLAQLFLRVAAELVTELRQDDLAGVHQDDPEHVLSEVRIKPDRVTQKVIHAGNRLYARESSAGHHEVEQGLAYLRAAFEV